MMAANESVALECTSLNVDLADSELLRAKPWVLHIPTAETYLAVAELSISGADCMFADGKHVAEQRLTRDCLSQLDASVAAKVKWHYADMHDTKGYGDAAREWLSIQKKPRLPVTLCSDVEAGEWLLYIPANLNWFDGHFPGQPVLPGVVQIDWAIYYAKQLGFETNSFLDIPRVKFSAIIEPEAVLRLTLEKNSHGLRFLYRSAAVVHSQGTIAFA
jgi:hypothetical protein